MRRGTRLYFVCALIVEENRARVAGADQLAADRLEQMLMIRSQFPAAHFAALHRRRTAHKSGAELRKSLPAATVAHTLLSRGSMRLQHLDRHEALLLLRAFDDQRSDVGSRLIHRLLHHLLRACAVEPQPCPLACSRNRTAPS